MTQRILIAVPGILFLLLALFWRHGEIFIGVMALLGIVGVWEIASALKSKGRTVPLVWPMLGVGALIATACLPQLGIYRMPALVALFLFALTWETFSDTQKAFERVSLSLMLTAYAGLSAIPIALRLQGSTVYPNPSSQVETGALWVLTAFLTVWLVDSGAYFVGRAWGKHKLAPRLSPSKTWEGAFGGWVFAVLLGIGLGYWGDGRLFQGGILSGLAYGALAGVWAQVGDLVESGMKREIGVKDFGGWLPGHGGALDRFDSFLFICPLVYVWSYFSL